MATVGTVALRTTLWASSEAPVKISVWFSAVLMPPLPITDPCPPFSLA